MRVSCLDGRLAGQMLHAQRVVIRSTRALSGCASTWFPLTSLTRESPRAGGREEGVCGEAGRARGDEEGCCQGTV
jgi:hypothetical protein